MVPSRATRLIWSVCVNNWAKCDQNNNNDIDVLVSEAYPACPQISKMECFPIIANG